MLKQKREWKAEQAMEARNQFMPSSLDPLRIPHTLTCSVCQGWRSQGMRPSLPLLVKLAGATLTGAAAILLFRRLGSEEAISSLRRDIRDALFLLCRDGAGLPVVLVTGFGAHGRSSFINTACRALAGEGGPLLLRVETAPPGPTPATLARHVIHAEVGEADEAVELVDAPPLPEAGRLTRADVEAALEAGGALPAPECVIVVIRCGVPAKERHMAIRKLPDIASVARDRGLHLVVVLTHKKALRTMKHAEELRREVAFRARTDCVFFIENYTATPNIRHPINIRNDFETHLTVLAIIRQCIQFVVMHRSRLSRKATATVPPTNEPTLAKEQ